MNYPFDSSTYRLLVEVERNQAMYRSAMSALGPMERMRREQEMIIGVLPYYEATRKLLGITGGLEDRAALAARAQEVADSLTPGVPRLQRAMLDLLADRARLDRAVGSSFLPSLELIDALTRASASIEHTTLAGRAYGPIAFEPMRETVALTLSIRSLVEEQIDPAELRPEIRGIWDGLTRVTAASTAVWDRLAENSAELVQLPEFLREVPVLQGFEATRSTGLLLVEEPELIDAEPAAGLLVTEAGEIVARLRAIHAHLADKYLGALENFQHRGRDYVAQTSVSLRELFVHLFETIAPEEAIKAWDPSVLPEKGKVTYKAHLKYIYRGQATAGYVRMTANEMDLVEQNLKVLNEGVHKLSPEFEYEHMRSLVRRCEYCLVSILHAHEVSARAG